MMNMTLWSQEKELFAYFLKNDVHAVVTPFVFKPYVYKDPVVPGGWFNNRATVLRAGDSLMSGDSSLASGFLAFAGILYDLFDELGSDDESSDDESSDDEPC